MRLQTEYNQVKSGLTEFSKTFKNTRIQPRYTAVWKRINEMRELCPEGLKHWPIFSLGKGFRRLILGVNLGSLQAGWCL